MLNIIYLHSFGDERTLQSTDSPFFAAAEECGFYFEKLNKGLTPITDVSIVCSHNIKKK